MRAVVLVAMLALVFAMPAPAFAEVETSGPMQGADVEGTVWLRIEPGGGPLSGTIEMFVRFDCRGKVRHERHVLDISGQVEGDRIRGTALYLGREGLPKDELSRCKSAYETYASREDSRAFVGVVDEAGATASGTLGESGGTVAWRVSWAGPPEQQEDDRGE